MEAGAHYRRVRLRLTGLLEGLDGEAWERPVPCCPGWRVRDVLAHVHGNVEDAVAGRLAGPPSEAQTAEQVQRHADDDPVDLLARWVEVAPGFEAAISELGALPAAIDLLTHEQDIRHALDRPGGRDDELIGELAQAFLGRVAGAGLELRATPYEVFRAAMGRRSLEQVRSLDWSDEPDAVLTTFFVFGPATEAVLEP